MKKIKQYFKNLRYSISEKVSQSMKDKGNTYKDICFTLFLSALMFVLSLILNVCLITFMLFKIF